MRFFLFFLSATLAAGVGLAAYPDAKVIKAPGKLATLVKPPSSFCKTEAARRQDDLRSSDRVLCWIRGQDDGGAIPFRFFLNAYPVISDAHGVFVHDVNAGFARAFEPSADFTFHGWRNGIMVIAHKDGTVFSALSGVAFAGKRKGTRLKPIPSITAEWRWWNRRYPNSVAFQMFAKYVAVEPPIKESAPGLKTAGKVDPRLPGEERILGVRLGKETKAYRLADLRKAVVLADKLDDRPCVLLYQADTKTAAAYSPIALPPRPGPKARVLTLRAGRADGKTGRALFFDRQTGSTWDVAGRAVAGPLQGWTLTWLDGVEVKWFAWSAEYPRTRVHGK